MNLEQMQKHCVLWLRENPKALLALDQGLGKTKVSLEASEEDALRKLEYDLYYIKNQSIFIDMLVVFRTIKTVLFQKGSR